MDALKQKIITLLEIAGGVLLYPDLLNEMDGLERQSLIRVLDTMADEGALHQLVTWDPDTNTNRHTVHIGKREVTDGNSV